MVYQLSSTLKGHGQDVKDLVAIDDERIASVSRDGSVRVWSRTRAGQGAWEDTVVFQTESFLNSICYDARNQVVYFAGKDSMVNGTSVFATIDANSITEPMYTLIGHEGNVCCLFLLEDELVSGSWDKTAKVWSRGHLKWNLTGHAASVWDAKILPGNENHFITVSADASVKLWEGDSITKSFDNIHRDVIRHVVVLNDEGTLFATCSNDTFIKIFDIEGKVHRTLEGHDSFVYYLKVNHSTHELISCGEDKTVRIWDYQTGEIKQVIRLPAISIWCLDILPNGDIAVGSSDKMIRIFTRDSNRVAPQSELDALKDEVESTTLNSRTMDFDESKLSPYEILQTPGNKEGQLVVVRSPAGVIEAHQFSSGSWSKVGDVVGASGTGSDNKKEYEGKMYDFVFDVDIEDGKPALKLPVNASDNPYEVADKFIVRYELPTSYRDQIVNFIITNTGGVSLDAPSENTNTTQPKAKTTTSTSGGGGNKIKGNMNVLPVTAYLSMKSYKPDTIFNGIVKINSNETKSPFNDEELALLGSSLHDLDSNWEILYAYSSRILENWDNKTPAYDMVRLLVTHLPHSTDISPYIDGGLNNSNITTTMLTARILVNCFGNRKWGHGLMSSTQVYSSIFETIDTIFPEATLRQSQNLAIAVSTLLLNYSVMVVEEKDAHLDIVPILAEAINNKYGVLEEYQTSEEAAYRLVVAYGNLSLLEPTLRQFAKSISWLNQVRRRYADNARFQAVFADMD